MHTVKANFSKVNGPVKPMHAVNNGPVHSRAISNMKDFREAGIPYARNHDAAFNASYGGSHSVDIPNIFTDFDADPYDPASYDFALTDVYLKQIAEGGSGVFYRLGVKIEHESKKYGTVPPADFRKWAVICEHIIRHYNEGWADGLHMGIIYWEIWNEPDLHELMWQGTDEMYYELYSIAATHLKACFPEIKVGGPAVSSMNQEGFLKGFFEAITAGGGKVPMDFFSWHCYETDPRRLADTARQAREWCDRYGYTGCELILNEWNYVLGWYGDEIIATYKAIRSMRAAAFVAGCMCESQRSPMDMLMYYDARPCAFNGMFEYGTLERLRGYYPFLMWNALYQRKHQASSGSDDKELLSCAAAGEQGEALLVVYYPQDEKKAKPREVTLQLQGITGCRKMTVTLLDEENTYRRLFTETLEADRRSLTLRLEPHACLLVTLDK
jgi:hypothetical protein